MPTDSWLTKSPSWANDMKTLLLCDKKIDHDSPVKMEEILEKSSNFPIKFPVTTVCCSQLKQKSSKIMLERNINSAYPVIHEYSLYLYAMFLLYQKKFGNTAFYKDMSLLQLVDRLLSKRAVSFVGKSDSYILLDGSRGHGEWEQVGTSREKAPLTLRNCLSYDEIKLSALLSVSSRTYFINDGNRNNQGLPEQNIDETEATGVIVGLVGARLEKDNVMEYREIVKSKKQNTVEHGYGKPDENSPPTLQQKFLEFYGDKNATYSEILNDLRVDHERYLNLGGDIYFDKLMYERRISLSIDTLLIEANKRAKEEDTTAYVHVVGIGLGEWKICDDQNKFFVETFATRLKFLKDVLTNVSDVCFAFIGEKTIGSCTDGGRIGGITIHIRNHDPHDILKGVNWGKLLVVSYGWDGNALPGNEFWCGSLTGGGDQAAASSTQIAELHNYHINRNVRGTNLMVATLEHGLVSFWEYQDLHRKN